MCGEQAVFPRLPRSSPGSSPRVRGTELPDFAEGQPFGIIPACAGNRETLAQKQKGARDHPRVCGEQSISCRYRHSKPGSSPRVRGTGILRLLLVITWGIIPACAGNSLPQAPVSPSQRDHPRVCGEQSREPKGSLFGLGSSPRVRGTDLLCLLTRQAVGIIPACAGNSHCDGDYL